MKRILIICAVLAPLSIFAQTSFSPEADSIIYTVVEDMPEFVGGKDAMYKYIGDNLHYPLTARRYGLEGTVFTAFVVEKDGDISNVKVVKGMSGELDDEAKRVISEMPNWKPGKQNGQLVRVRFVLPIRFRLTGKKR
jgi:protein TonB